MNANVILAVFKRNFLSYFSSPIGYVFICAFVLLSGFAAFWPSEFFNGNLATLDQLNLYLPWIMLVFIPAITMSIWAEERRQGTDELLLTLPCTDLDVVIGKYLAALAIYSVALIFSLGNIVLLRWLGKPDIGLLLGNYVGYWLVGAAMISIGMVASFLTNSLTVGFVLALALNAPLVFARSADSIVSWDPAARFIKSASISEQFADFGKGLLTLSGVVFFASIILVSLYLSMVLIGRRHWGGGRYGTSMAGHFLLRAVSLIAIAVGINVLVGRFDARADISQERINSLSPHTLAVLRHLDTPRPVYVEAYISPHVPEQYVQTQLNLRSMLREASAIGGDKVIVRIHDTPRFSEEEAQAAQQFGIHPQMVQNTEGGKLAVDQIVLGAAFTCGLEKVVVPFFDRGIPPEYEIVRSIATVSQQKRKRIGVLTTDAKMFGGFEMESMTNRADEPIIDELKKQYEVVPVNPANPIEERYDALLAVQPSTLSPPQLANFVAAVRNGQPTAIFEDPFPSMDPSVTPTSAPKMPPRRSMFSQQQPPMPKGDIKSLWNVLGIRFHDQDIVWQDYNPYPKLHQIPREIVFIGKGSGAAEPFNQSSPVTSGLQQLVTMFAGSIEPAPNATTHFTPLVSTGKLTGTVAFSEMIQRNMLGGGGLNPNRRFRSTKESYVLAAAIRGQAAPPPGSANDASRPAASDSTINAVVVSDIDILYSTFFAIRARGADRNDPVNLNIDNVTFVLNALDYLAGDDRFLELRKRRPAYRTLTAVEQKIELSKTNADVERKKFLDQFDAKRDEEQKRLDNRVAELKARPGIDTQEMLNDVAIAQQEGQTRLQNFNERMEKERDQELEKIERNLAMQVRHVQDNYKLAAIAFPPIPPVLVGGFVFLRRKSMERIGVPKARLRHG